MNNIKKYFLNILFLLVCSSYCNKIIAASVVASTHTYTITICENSSATNIDSFLAVTDTSHIDTIIWNLVLSPLHGIASVSFSTLAIGSTIIPTGMAYIPAIGYTGIDSFKVKINYGASYDSITILINVNPLPAIGLISGLDSICVGTVDTLSAITSGGIWSTSNHTIDTINTTGILYAIASGIDTIEYTTTNSCGTRISYFPVYNNPSTTSGTITGPDTLCRGTSITLTDTVAGGIWSSSSLFIARVDSFGITRGIGTGYDTISYLIGSPGSCHISAKKVVYVANINAGTITGNNAICIDSIGTVTLTDSLSGGIWSSANPSIATVSSAGIVTPVSGGKVKIAYTINTAACGNIADSFNFSVDYPLQPLIGKTTICVDTLMNIVFTNPSGGTWSSTNPFIAYAIAIPGVGISDIFGLTVGSAVLTYKLNNSCGNYSDTETINVINCNNSVPTILDKEGKLFIAPNPNKGAFIVNYKSATQQSVNIFINDMTGKTIFMATVPTNQEIEFNLQLPAGLYVLNTESGESIKYEKLLIMQ